MTALWDAVGAYLRNASGRTGQHVLVLYTDGGDSTSRLRFDQLLTMLRAANVMVYAIGYLENQLSSSRTTGQMYLTNLAREAGGDAFFPSSPKELHKIYARILDEIGSRYTIGYVSTNTKPDGKFRKVQVKLPSPEHKSAKVAARAPGSRWHDQVPGSAAGADRQCLMISSSLVWRMSMSPAPAVGERFSLESDFELRGDQPRAIAQLTEALRRGDKSQVLLGVTGSGKTFTMAQVLAEVNRPALVMVHNKTLAAQLYQEFRRFFPRNAVEFFVSYYDYYQPEAFMPASNTYIEKEAIINEEIDRLRLSATRSLFERRDVIIVASVSCIYGLGSPESYYGLLVPLEKGQQIARDEILRRFVEIQYERNDHDFTRGTFRVRGDIIELYPSYEDVGLRISLFGDEIDELLAFDPLTGKDVRRHERISVFPKSHFVAPRKRTMQAIEGIKAELQERVAEFERRRPRAGGAAPSSADDVRSRDDS